MDDGGTLYPLGLRMRGRLAVVVGAGAVAVRRVGGLRAAGAEVMVIAPELSPTLADLAARAVIAAHRRPFEPGDLDGAWLVLACTNSAEVNARVAAEAESRRLWCVRADDAAESSAWVPAVGRTADLTVAVNAGDPRRAATVRDRLVDAMDTPADDAHRPQRNRPGRVAIVGGGPGDPGLLTVRGRDLLRRADVVVTDRLAPLAVLDELGPHVEVVDAAKVPGGIAARQDDINRLLVEHAKAGRFVVRLKGGDPYVFGRGREEVAAACAGGVPVEVVPGVTSATAVPALAGIPVTHRGTTQGFTVVSGHVPPDDPRSTVDWSALARAGTTLVLLMTVENLPSIVEALRTHGMPASTPTACVTNGSTSRQRLVAAPLGELVADAREAGVVNPAVVVIGEVARLAVDETNSVSAESGGGAVR